MRHLSSNTNQRPLRVLVVIASYGEKNLGFLRQIIRTYRNMAFQTKVVVCSEAPKDLGPEVEVRVGLPSRNPWTLPFAHKAVFAEQLEAHDLFIYSEDDIGVTQAHIEAFLGATPQLNSDEIAGFLRFELDRQGTKYLAEAWGHFHWKPESVRQRGEHTVAEFTNEHAGFYILTRSQLKAAIASGGFLRSPCRGRYDWPETAATDPYTNCGFRKVICISALEDFLVHHLPNKYVDKLDVSLEAFQQQVRTLLQIQGGEHPARTAWEVEPKTWPTHWQKAYYEKSNSALLDTVPAEAKTVLSIGCGWGANERRLAERGARVTVVPLDSVIGAAVAQRGLKVVYGSADECFRELDGCQFDCVLIANLLHLQPEPGELAARCAQLVRLGGVLVVSGPNFSRLPWVMKRLLRRRGFDSLGDYARSGICLCSPGTVTQGLAGTGLEVTEIRWLDHEVSGGVRNGLRVPLGPITARNWILQARRAAPAQHP